ncbi:MAG: hypothetical protein SF097_14840 [Acidobacteriota bacterium]|nr:hypothetical protein [Acidobacteriota bacterium]
MAKNKVITRETAEKRFQAAIRAADTLRDDPDLADEIEDEGVEEWAERKGYIIENPGRKGGKKAMPRINSAALQEENEVLREENESLRARLSDINTLSQDDEDEFDDDEFDDDEDDDDDYEDDDE